MPMNDTTKLQLNWAIDVSVVLVVLVEQRCFQRRTSAVLAPLETVDLRLFFPPPLCKSLMIIYYSYYNLCLLAIIFLSQGERWYELTSVGVERMDGDGREEQFFPCMPKCY